MNANDLKSNLVILAVIKKESSAIQTGLGTEPDARFGNHPDLRHLPFYRYNWSMSALIQVAKGQDPKTFPVMREPVSWLPKAI